MNKQTNKIKMLMFISVVTFAVSFFSLSAIPFTNALTETTERMVSNIIAIVFYLGLILGIVFNVMANRQIKKNGKKLVKEMQENQKLPGVITFSTDKMHIVLYSVLVIAIVVMVSDMIFGWVASYIMFPVISFTLLLFVIHCIIDGKHFKIYTKMKKGVDNE